MHGSRGALRHDEGEEAEVAGSEAEEEPLADTASHTALWRRGLILLGEPTLAGRSSEKRRRRDSTASTGSLARSIVSLTLDTKERVAGVSRMYSSSPDR